MLDDVNVRVKLVLEMSLVFHGREIYRPSGCRPLLTLFESSNNIWGDRQDSVRTLYRSGRPLPIVKVGIEIKCNKSRDWDVSITDYISSTS